MTFIYKLLLISLLALADGGDGGGGDGGAGPEEEHPPGTNRHCRNIPNPAPDPDNPYITICSWQYGHYEVSGEEQIWVEDPPPPPPPPPPPDQPASTGTNVSVVNGPTTPPDQTPVNMPNGETPTHLSRQDQQRQQAMNQSLFGASEAAANSMLGIAQGLTVKSEEEGATLIQSGEKGLVAAKVMQENGGDNSPTLFPSHEIMKSKEASKVFTELAKTHNVNPNDFIQRLANSQGQGVGALKGLFKEDLLARAKLPVTAVDQDKYLVSFEKASANGTGLRKNLSKLLSADKKDLLAGYRGSRNLASPSRGAEKAANFEGLKSDSNEFFGSKEVSENIELSIFDVVHRKYKEVRTRLRR